MPPQQLEWASFTATDVVRGGDWESIEELLEAAYGCSGLLCQKMSLALWGLRGVLYLIL